MTIKYIYFAGNNLLGTKYYRKALIIGETADICHRQCLYSPGKGMPTPQTGDLLDYKGVSGLLYPFLLWFKAPDGITDRHIHTLFKTSRPFTDFVYPINDMKSIHTKEAFGVLAPLRLEIIAEQLQRLLFDYLGIENLLQI